MRENAVTIPRLGWEIPKPKFWDLVAVGLVIASLAIAGWGWATVRGLPPGASVSGLLAGLWTSLQLAISIGGLLVLGKTVKEGTIHGNLSAVLASLLGLTGVFLAAALAFVG